MDVPDRTEVLCEDHCSTNRGSVYFSQQFRCTEAPTQPRKAQQTTNTVILVCGFEVKKLSAIGLNTVSDAWYFLSKNLYSWELEQMSSSSGWLTIPGMPRLNRALWLRRLTWSQPYYSLTRTQVHTTKNHLPNWGPKRQITSKGVKLPIGRFEGRLLGTDSPKLREDGRQS